MSDPFPFLFYGRRSGNWYEGANDGHVYELVFQRAPSESERAAIAEAFEVSTAGGPVASSSKAWFWSERHALFFVGERWIGRFDAFFEGMDTCVRAVHRVAPLAEVRFLGSQSPGTAPWDAWTLERQAIPSPGPLYPGLMLRSIHREERREATPIPAPDDAFERARVLARKSADDSRSARKAAAAAKPKSAKPADAAPGALSAKLKKLKEPPPNLAMELERIFGSGVANAKAASGRRVALVVAEPKTYRVGISDTGGQRFADLPAAAYQHLALHDDGRHALVSTKDALWEVDLESGVSRSLELSGLSKLSGVAYGPDDRLAVLASYPPIVHLLARNGGALSVLATERCPEAFWLGAVRGGRVLVVTSMSKGKTLLLVAHKTTLQTVAFGKEKTSDVSVDGDRLFLSGVGGTWEVTNLDEIEAAGQAQR